MEASTLQSDHYALRSKRFLEECHDFPVEIAMKRLPIEARIVCADLRSLFGQRFAARRKERVVPCPSLHMLLGRTRKSLPAYRTRSASLSEGMSSARLAPACFLSLD